MASFNKVILVGNMTTDPELKQTTTGTSVCSFSIAVNRRFTKPEQGQQTVDFINIVKQHQPIKPLHYRIPYQACGASLVAQLVKKPSAMRETQIPGLGKSHGEGKGYAL